MMEFPLIIVIVLLFAACVALTVLQWKFRHWPPSLWAMGVLKRVQELRNRLDNLLNPPRGGETAAEKLAAELFGRQKQGVSVEVLKNYKGIGPGTVAMLQNEGIRTLPQAEDHVNAFLFKKKIQNVGQVREEAIANAVKELLMDERRRFDEAGSPEGLQYQSQLAKLSADEQERAAAKAREQIALQQCLEKMAPFEALARGVTFARFLFQRDVPGLTAEVMAMALPGVEIAPATLPLPERGASAPRVPPAVPPGVLRLQAYCNFALLVAKADGRIAQAERAKIRNYLGELFGSDAMLLRYLDPQLERSEANLPEEADAITAIQSVVAKADWPSLYSFAQQIAAATGDPTEKEKQFLARLAKAFELNPLAEAEAKPPPSTVGPSARDVLGIPAKAELSVELIRRKYTMLSEQIDPEKAAALGPEFAAMAEAKRTAIQAAAVELLAPLGAPLEAPAPPPPSNKMRENSDLDDLFGSLQRG